MRIETLQHVNCVGNVVTFSNTTFVILAQKVTGAESKGTGKELVGHDHWQRLRPEDGERLEPRGRRPSKGSAVGPRLRPATLPSATPPLRRSPSPTNTQHLALPRLPQAPDPRPPAPAPCPVNSPVPSAFPPVVFPSGAVGTRSPPHQGPPSLQDCSCDAQVR